MYLPWLKNNFPDFIKGWYLTGVTIHPDWRRKGVGQFFVKINSIYKSYDIINVTK